MSDQQDIFNIRKADFVSGPRGRDSVTQYCYTTGVQYMRNNPGRFIESSTDRSWLRYLACLSQQGTWADAIVIQAVADALNLTIYIIESNPGFASVTNIGAVGSETDTTVITIGHLDEVHCFNCSIQ